MIRTVAKPAGVATAGATGVPAILALEHLATGRIPIY